MADGSRSALALARGRGLGPALIVLLAVGVRAWVAGDQEIMFNDGPEFLGVAQLLLQGEFREALSDPYHPLTAISIALTSAVSGMGLESSGIAVSVLSGGVATAALYLLTRDLFGQRVALVAALLFAVHPEMVEVSSNVQSDGLHLALFLIGALLAWRALESGRFSHALGAGILCGLAYLTRPEGLAIGVILVGWLLLDLAWGRISWRGFISVTAGFATAVLLFGGPYLVGMRVVKGEWLLTQKKRIAPIEWSLPQPARVAEALTQLGRAGFGGVRVPYIALALCAFRRRRPNRPTLYPLSYVALLVPVLLGVQLQEGYISDRHWLVSAALLMPFAAIGSWQVGSWLKGALPPLHERAWAVPAAVGLLVVAVLAHDLRPQTEPVKRARKQAALWLRAQEPYTVAAPRARVAYYAGAPRHVDLNLAPEPDKLDEWLRAQAVDFVIAEAEALPSLPPGGTPGLREIHRVEYPGGNVYVLRIERAPDVAAPSP